MSLFLLLVLLFLITLILGTAAYGGKSAAIWVPLLRHDVIRAIDLAQIKQGDVVYDLGCGDGRVVIAAAERGARAIGYEVAFVPYLIAIIRSRCTRLRYWNVQGSCEIHYRNFWKQDISDAAVVYIYLLPSVYGKVMQKITTECKPGTRLITSTWAMPNWDVDAVSEVEGKPKLYRYVV